MCLQSTRVVVIGLGKIGGSLAGALRARVPGCHVTGIDSDPAVRALALERQCVDTMTDQFEAAVGDANMIVLATQVSVIVSLVEQVSPLLSFGAVLVDTGSTKVTVVSAMNERQTAGHFFGGHPIAGNERTGADAWDDALFVDRTFVLVRTRSSTDESARRVADLVGAIGAHVRWMDATQHDEILATTSHLPLLMGVALAIRAGEMVAGDLALVRSLTGGQYRALTRLVHTPPDVLADIIDSNRIEIAAAWRAVDRHAGEMLAAPRTELITRLRGAAADKERLA